MGSGVAFFPIGSTCTKLERSNILHRRKTRRLSNMLSKVWTYSVWYRQSKYRMWNFKLGFDEKESNKMHTYRMRYPY